MTQNNSILNKKKILQQVKEIFNFHSADDLIHSERETPHLHPKSFLFQQYVYYNVLNNQQIFFNHLLEINRSETNLSVCL